MSYENLIGNKNAVGGGPNVTSFSKGMIPWNKGMKGLHNSPGTEFKKGCAAENRLPVGSITQRKSKNGTLRNFIKVADPNLWQEHAKFVWEKKYGKLKDGDITHHKDGNSLNDEPQNIIAMPRADHPVFHGRWGLKSLSEDQEKIYISRYLS